MLKHRSQRHLHTRIMLRVSLRSILSSENPHLPNNRLRNFNQPSNDP